MSTEKNDEKASFQNAEVQKGHNIVLCRTGTRDVLYFLFTTVSLKV